MTDLQYDVHLRHFKQTVPNRNSGFLFNVFHIIPPTREVMHLHWHDEWEIIYTVKGNVAFHIGIDTFHPQPGDLLFVNKGLMHTGFSLDDEPVEYYALLFHPSVIGSGFAENYHMEIASPLVMGKRFIQPHITRDAPDYPQLAGMLDKLIAENRGKLSGYKLAIRSLLHLLLVHFTRNHLQEDGAQRVSLIDEESYERFKELFAYIEQHYAQKLTVVKAASIVNLSESHFCRTFKKITGKTFIEFVNLHRISVAAHLLESTATPVTEIAFQVGFNSINYFSQLFKHYKRCSPSQFRKQE